MTRRALVPFLALLVAALVRAQETEASEPWKVTAPPLPLTKLSFTTTSGTWLDLDVHPKSGEIVFSLLGEIYVMGPEGGKARLLRGGLQWDMHPRWSPEGDRIAYTSDEGGGDNLWIMEADGTGARAVTKETFRLLCSPRWSRDGRFLIGRRHYTSRRSLGAGEMWMYPVSGGAGIQLTERKNDQQDVNEPVFSPDGKTLYWSEDVSGGSTFEYNKDPNGQIYVVFAKDLESGRVRREITGNGGAVRPEPSPDGRRIAFIRRVRAKSVLHVKDLETGAIRALWDGLSLDAQETWAIHGVYPGFGWTPDGTHVVIWAQGGIWRVAMDTGKATRLPLSVDVELDIVKTLRHPMDMGGDVVRTRVCRWPAVSPNGEEVAYESLGRIWRRPLGDGAAVPVSPEDVMAITPSWSPDGQSIVYATWNDVDGGRVRLAANQDFRHAGDRNRVLVDDPGHYGSPSFSKDGQWVVYERIGGDGLRGQAFTHQPGIYRIRTTGGRPELVCERGSRPRFDGMGGRIFLHEREGEELLLTSVDIHGHERRIHARSKDATEYAVSPDGRWLAFTELWNAYICPLPATGGPLTVSPDMKALPVERLSRDAGQDLSFSPDGGTVYYGLANELFAHSVSSRFLPPFGTREETEKKPRDHHDQARRHDLSIEVPADMPTGEILFANARIVTMDGDRIIEGGAVHVKGNRIFALYTAEEVAGMRFSSQVTYRDVEGRTILPGFVDVHAHIGHGSSGIAPQRNWQHLANLSFGVTTTHDPSSETRQTFATAELQRAGRILAPRIFSTGTILYGAGGSFRAVIDSLDDARSHIRRTAAFGATTVKSYNQPRRDQRQQVLVAARELGIMVVPEGGSTLQHNLTHIVDGHTTLEHALPVAPFYDDVLTLFSKSGTAYTPTLIVGYGGIWGENYWYHKERVWENDRLLRWMPRSMLDVRSRRRVAAPDDEYNHIALAQMAAELARRGTIVEVGAHGQIQGLGVHWEMRMFEQGGMTPLDALRTGTIWAARALGMDGQVGSIAEGKLADLVVVDGDPTKDLRDAERVALVMLNGRLYDGLTLHQLYPEDRPLPAGPRLEVDDLGGAATGCPCGAH